MVAWHGTHWSFHTEAERLAGVIRFHENCEQLCVDKIRAAGGPKTNSLEDSVAWLLKKKQPKDTDVVAAARVLLSVAEKGSCGSNWGSINGDLYGYDLNKLQSALEVYDGKRKPSGKTRAQLERHAAHLLTEAQKILSGLANGKFDETDEDCEHKFGNDGGPCIWCGANSTLPMFQKKS